MRRRILLAVARWSYRALVTIAVCSVVATDGVAAKAGEDIRNVLVLYSADQRLPSTNIVGDAVTEKLLASASPKVVVYSDFLDLVRFPGKEYSDNLAAFLARKYADVKFDLVIALAPPALDFIVGHRDKVAPGSRIVFALVAKSEVSQFQIVPGDAVGVFSEYSVAKTMDLANRLQPHARRIVVVTGASEFDRAWEQIARDDLVQTSKNREVTYLTGLAFDDIINQVSRLPRETIVLILSVFQDGTGRRFVPREATREIANAATAPSYGVYDNWVGVGIVGAYSDTFESTGASLGDLALEALIGKPNASADRINLNRALRIDARQITRWGFSKTDLPPDAIVLFDEKSLWEQHGNIIIAVLAILVLQSALLAGLLVQGTRRRRAEASLRESEERMAIAAASANLGLWHFDLPQGLFWATDHCRAMFGLARDVKLAPEDLLGRIHPDDQSTVEEGLRKLRSGVPFVGEFRLAASPDETRWLQSSGDVRTDSKTGRMRVSGTFKDVTAGKKAEEDLELQRRELAHLTRVSVLGQLSGAIAHELNQPLTAILANAQAAKNILLLPEPDLSEAAAALNDIVAEDHRAGEVIRRLLGLLQKKEGKSEDVDLNEIARSTLRLLHSEFIRRRIKTVVELSERIPAVLGDGIQLQQVLINLLVNAMDELDSIPLPTRRIEIRTTVQASGSVSLSIEDSGRGLSPEQADKVFEPFFTTKAEGLGLGLPICATIISRHGGILRVHNGSHGGLCAMFTLPVHEAMVAAQ
jgi:C4-dicarboxylate-specific signal transduction histidine kinase